MPRHYELDDEEVLIIQAYRKAAIPGVMQHFGKQYPPPAWAIAGVPTSDELELDEFPMRSEGEDGCWVACWYWVTNPTVGEIVEGDNDVHNL